MEIPSILARAFGCGCLLYAALAGRGPFAQGASGKKIDQCSENIGNQAYGFYHALASMRHF
jgi:hypothetical protein